VSPLPTAPDGGCDGSSGRPRKEAVKAEVEHAEEALERGVHGSIFAAACVVVAALVMADIPTTYVPSARSGGGKGGESSRRPGVASREAGGRGRRLKLGSRLAKRGLRERLIRPGPCGR
jgi:hypothetical protein